MMELETGRLILECFVQVTPHKERYGQQQINGYCQPILLWQNGSVWEEFDGNREGNFSSALPQGYEKSSLAEYISTLCEKCPTTEFFLFRISPHSD